MIKSIFGLTTEDVRKQQLKQQQAAAQQFAKQTGANQGVASIGTAIGAGLGRGLMSRLGFEDPEMVKAQEVEAKQTALNQQLAGLDPSDPRALYITGNALLQEGLVEEAARFLQLAAVQEKSQSEGSKKAKQKENIGRPPEVIEIKDNEGNVVSLEMRTWNDLGEEKRTQVKPDEMLVLLQALGQRKEESKKESKEGQNATSGKTGVVTIPSVTDLSVTDLEQPSTSSRTREDVLSDYGLK